MGNVLTVAENVGSNANGGWFSASTTGVLSYRTGRAPIASDLAWFDRTGKRLGQLGLPMEIVARRCGAVEGREARGCDAC